ncbi:MAG: hypothetical protein IID39_04930 [Planctomycetes bacterium]|nr:hypothetical protein [Planctomycetota bacterium]
MSKDRLNPAAVRLLTGACGLVVALTGCAHTEKEPTFQQRWPSVGWSLVSKTDFLGLHNDYVLLTSTGTVGLFPCSLAVARITKPVETGSNRAAVVELAMTPANEMIDWMKLFDDCWLISNTFPVTYPDLEAPEVETEQLVERARLVGAGLCLIYGVSEDDSSETEIYGALYDTRDGKLIAAAHAQVRLDGSTDTEAPPGRHENDLRHIDPRVIVQERFRRLVADCVSGLISDDYPLAQRPPPGGWTHEQPVEPVMWRPVYNRPRP